MSDKTNIDLDAIPRQQIPAAIAYLAARLLNPESASQSRIEESDPLLTAPEAAAGLHLAPSYVYELVRSRQLPAVRSGKYVRIRRSAVERFIAQHEDGVDNYVSIMHTLQHATQRDKAQTPTVGIESSRTRPTPGRASSHRLAMGARRLADAKGRERVTQIVGPGEVTDGDTQKI
jgi:excisionase family DNA binding protein